MLSASGWGSTALLSVAVIGLAVSQWAPMRSVVPLRTSIEGPLGISVAGALGGSIAGPLGSSISTFHKRTRDSLQVQITPSTLSVERRQAVRLRATHDFDYKCGRVDATIPELNWQQSLTRTELFNGVEVQLNPVRTGQFSIVFSCDEREIGTAAISVVLPPKPSRPIVRPTRFVLFSGSPNHRDGSFFLLPVMIRVEEQRDGAWGPVPVARDTDFRLLDSNGQVGQELRLTIAKNTAMSDPVYLTFGVKSDYNLTAFQASDGRTSNALRVSWKMVGPPLSLQAIPNRIELYASAISTASVSLYLADSNVELRPPESLNVLITNPPNVRSDPSDRLILTPQGPVGTYKASGRSRATAAQVSFFEPTTNARGVLDVTVRSTFLFTLSALIGGLFGGVATRIPAVLAMITGSASRKETLELLLGLAISVVAGWGLYFGSLNGVFSFLSITELNYGMALFLGVIGGVAGVSVFTWVVKRWFP